jgi:ribonuclease D
MPNSTNLVDSQPQLDALCDNLARISADPVGFDTEFVRTQTFWPELCIVQVAFEGRQEAIDLLAETDTTRLRKQLLEKPGLEIFHAAKQDLEALYSVFGALPLALFDTQIAAGLLGYQPQIGYAGLVRELLDIEIPKDQTRTDWSKRPLTPAQLDYALADVEHLHELFDILTARLRETGRDEWALEDSALLLDTSLYAVPAELAWQRLSSVPYLPVPEQARARRLAGWREERARAVNRPRQWVLADKAVLAIAHTNPRTPADLSRIDDIPPGIIRKQGKAIVDVVRAANAEVDSGDAEFAQQPLPKPPDKNDVKRLSGLVRAAAENLGIAPEILATRKDVTGIMNGRENLRVLSGWRREAIGQTLLEAVRAG